MGLMIISTGEACRTRCTTCRRVTISRCLILQRKEHEGTIQKVDHYFTSEPYELSPVVSDIHSQSERPRTEFSTRSVAVYPASAGEY